MTYFGSGNGYSGIELTGLAKCVVAVFVLFASVGIGFMLYVIWLFLSAHVRWIG